MRTEQEIRADLARQLGEIERRFAAQLEAERPALDEEDGARVAAGQYFRNWPAP